MEIEKQLTDMDIQSAMKLRDQIEAIKDDDFREMVLRRVESYLDGVRDGIQAAIGMGASSGGKH